MNMTPLGEALCATAEETSGNNTGEMVEVRGKFTPLGHTKLYANSIQLAAPTGSLRGSKRLQDGRKAAALRFLPR